MLHMQDNLVRILQEWSVCPPHPPFCLEIRISANVSTNTRGAKGAVSSEILVEWTTQAWIFSMALVSKHFRIVLTSGMLKPALLNWKEATWWKYISSCNTVQASELYNELPLLLYCEKCPCTLLKCCDLSSVTAGRETDASSTEAKVCRGLWAWHWRE